MNRSLLVLGGVLLVGALSILALWLRAQRSTSPPRPDLAPPRPPDVLLAGSGVANVALYPLDLLRGSTGIIGVVLATEMPVTGTYTTLWLRDPAGWRSLPLDRPMNLRAGDLALLPVPFWKLMSRDVNTAHLHWVTGLSIHDTLVEIDETRALRFSEDEFRQLGERTVADVLTLLSPCCTLDPVEVGELTDSVSAFIHAWWHERFPF